MSAEALGAVLGLALVDSLNPSTIAQATVLSAGTRPVRSVLAFWSGALATYLLLGTLLVLGPGVLVQEVLSDPPRWLRLLCLGIGPALVGAGVVLARRPRSEADPAAAGSLRRVRTNVAFGMGVLSTAVDAFTAAPYFAATAVVTGSALSLAGQVGVLGLYNLVYLAPVLAVLVLRLTLGPRAEPVFAAFFSLLARFGPPALAFLLVAGGIALGAVGAAAL